MTLHFNVVTDLGHDIIGFVYSENKRNLIQIFWIEKLPKWISVLISHNLSFTSFGQFIVNV